MGGGGATWNFRGGYQHPVLPMFLLLCNIKCQSLIYAD